MDKIGRGGMGERSLFVLEAASPDDIPAGILMPGQHFVCLLAWDARGATVAELTAVAGRLLRAGCAYAVCWGPECERVHLAFDLADIEWRPDGPWAVTTGHARDPLADAIWFALFCARPDAAFEETCGSVLGVAVGSAGWAAELRAAFAAPSEFDARHLAGRG